MQRISIEYFPRTSFYSRALSSPRRQRRYDLQFCCQLTSIVGLVCSKLDRTASTALVERSKWSVLLSLHCGRYTDFTHAQNNRSPPPYPSPALQGRETSAKHLVGVGSRLMGRAWSIALLALVRKTAS